MGLVSHIKHVTSKRSWIHHLLLLIKPKNPIETTDVKGTLGISIYCGCKLVHMYCVILLPLTVACHQGLNTARLIGGIAKFQVDFVAIDYTQILRNYIKDRFFGSGYGCHCMCNSVWDRNVLLKKKLNIRQGKEKGSDAIVFHE